MKVIEARYEHATPGFPGVVLKFTETDGQPIGDAYVVVNGVIIMNWAWQYHVSSAYELRNDGRELDRFDNWVRNRYKNDLSVQG